MPTYGFGDAQPRIAKPAPARADRFENERTREVDALGSGFQSQGQAVLGQQQATAGGFAQQGAGFNPTAQSITSAGGMAPQPLSGSVQSKGGAVGMAGAGATGGVPSQLGLAAGGARPAPLSPSFAAARDKMSVSGGSPSLFIGGASGPSAAFAPASTAGLGAASAALGGGRPIAPAPPSGPAAFQTGFREGGQNLGGIQDVNTASLGGYGSVMGGLGGAPGAVAGQLGGAPQVGTVGNIQTGSAPGQVAGTLGTMGASSADQQSMMARLNGFLDAPEGASVAEAQLQQAQANNVGQMLGMARSGRGGAGAQAQALAGAMSEGSAIASDTAGQLATLRAQEQDMRKNRALSAIGLGGDMATAARGQDLGYRGQDLAAAQGDQSTALGSRGQDIQAAMANQSTQSQLEQLRAQTALGARGQDLSALQGDQSTALGARGQDLQGLSADQGAAIAARGQNLSALQGNQSTALGMRGQNVAQEGNVLNANTALRAQDLSALTSDADRNLAAQQLALQGQLGFGGLQNQATGQGLDYLSNANQQALGAEGLKQGTIDSETAVGQAQFQRDHELQLAKMNAAAQARAAQAGKPSFLESLLPVFGTVAGATLAGPIGGYIGGQAGAAGARQIDSQNPYG